MKWARWLLPIALLLLGLPGASPLPAVDPGFVWMSFACAAASALVIAQLNRPYGDTLWAWILLFVMFVGYSVKTVIYANTLYSPELQLVSPEMDWITLGFLVRAYGWVTAATVYLGLALTILLQLGARFPIAHRGLTPPAIPARTISLLLAATLGLSLVAAILPVAFGFGLMGAASRTLPFRLDAIITRFRLNLAPALLLWLLWVTDVPDRRRTFRVAVLGLVFLALVDSVTRSSRGSLVLILLPAFMLWLITGRFTAGRRLATVVAMAVVIVLYPVLSLQRQARVVDGLGPLEAFRTASDIARTPDVLSAVLLKISTRVSGADGWWFVLARGADETPREWDGVMARGIRLALDNESMASLNTERIVGLHEEGDRRPPALLGALALIGGSPWAALFLLPVYATLSYLMWRAVARLAIAPVALALVGNALLFYTSEANMGVQDPISVALSLALVSVLHRWALRQTTLASPAEIRTSAHDGSVDQ